MLALYRLATRVVRPFARFILQHRVTRGKEDPTRIGERFGVASISDPPGNILWVHAASVGEMNSAQPLIERLLKRDPNCNILLTTGTITSGQRAAAWKNERVIHQYIPLDAQKFIVRFLRHWSPEAVIFIESEIWPNLIIETKKLGIPVLLINARISERSYRRWSGVAHFSATHLFGAFDLVTCQDENTVNLIRQLGAKDPVFLGNLKFSINPPDDDEDLAERLKNFASNASIIVGASTHPEDEPILLEAFQLVRADVPSVKMVIAPRHPNRASEVQETIAHYGFASTRIQEHSEALHDVLIIDRIGALGACYRKADSCFLGGGFGSRGGHTPVEGILLGCRILYGPDRRNFLAVAPLVEECKVAKVVKNARALAEEIIVDLTIKNSAIELDHSKIKALGDECLEKTVQALVPFLPKIRDHKG